MRDLRLDLDTADFERLFELGRSLIPVECPPWTDWNTHDPGIMLIELLAWIADAQTYSLSRLRRDERRAYAHLLGAPVEPPRGASGLIWPKQWQPTPRDKHVVIGENARISADASAGTALPAFHVSRALALTPATITRLVTHYAGGAQRDWTRVNEASAATFRPFEAPGGAPAALTLECDGVLIDRAHGEDTALVSVGFQIVRARAAGASSDDVSDDDIDIDIDPAPPQHACSPRVTLSVAGRDIALKVALDTTHGLLQSGVLLVEIAPAEAPQGGVFALVIEQAADARLIAPCVRRIALNVLPVRQIERGETFFDGTGLPDQTCWLDPAASDAARGADGGNMPATRFIVAPGEDAVTVESVDGGGEAWRVRDDIARCGPDERVFLFDPVQGMLRFGNGLNGRAPAAERRYRARYAITQGPSGNLNAGRAWRVQGASGFHGENPEPMRGGRLRSGDDDLQWTARRNVLFARPIVTSGDLSEAAAALPGLGVARACEDCAMRGSRDPRGERRLIAMHGEFTCAPLGDPAAATPSSEWLDAVRRALAPRLVLGQHLTVVAPRFVPIEVRAELIAQPGADPADVREAAALRLRVALQPLRRHAGDPPPWPFGRPLAPMTVRGWLRNVDGVAAVVSIGIRRAGRDIDGPIDGEIVPMGPRDLPWLASDESAIDVRRPGEGARP